MSVIDFETHRRAKSSRENALADALADSAVSGASALAEAMRQDAGLRRAVEAALHQPSAETFWALLRMQLRLWARELPDATPAWVLRALEDPEGATQEP